MDIRNGGISTSNQILKRKQTMATTFFLIGGLFLYPVRQTSLPKMPQIPDELRIARVVSGNDLFSETVYYSDPGLGVITDIEEQQNHELVVVGQRGAAFFSENRSSDRNVYFDRCNSDVVWSELGGGAFLCRGTWSKGTALFDLGGKTLWSYGGSASDAVDDAAAGYLGAGGTKTVVVGLNGGGGIRLLSSEGKELWKKEDANVWHVEIAAADEKSGNVILHSNARGQLTVRDATGTVLARYTPEIYLSHFSLTAWNDDPRPNKLIATERHSVYILTMEGKTVVQLPAPESITSSAEAKGTPVHFSADAPFYVSLVRHSLWTRSVLYTYDGQHQLIYDEVLAQDCAALHATPGENGTEDLLLGCDGVVFKYSQLKK